MIGKSETILIIEDETPIRRFLKASSFESAVQNRGDRKRRREAWPWPPPTIPNSSCWILAFPTWTDWNF